LRVAFDNIDFYRSGEEEVIVIGRLDAMSDAERLQRAADAQQRYKFRLDMAQLAGAKTLEAPKAPRGAVLTDDFAPADVYGAAGRRYRRDK